MRILVTGAAGFIGSHTVEHLVDSGHEVVAVDGLLSDSYAKHLKERNKSEVLACQNVEFVDFDLRDEFPEKILQGIDAIVHSAAMPGQRYSWSRTDLYTSCNVVATQKLLQQAVAHGVRHFIYISTSSVYGKLALGDEADPKAPVSPYGVTKLAAEHLVSAYHNEFQLPFTVLRLFSVYGPRQRPDMAYSRFINALVMDNPVTVHSDGRQTRASTYVLDAVRAISLALEKGPQGKAINISGTEQVSLIQVLDMLSQELGVSPRITFADVEVGDQLHTAPRIDLARSALGFQPRFDIAQGLRSQIRWTLASAE